jgi:hypothetical protein
LERSALDPSEALFGGRGPDDAESDVDRILSGACRIEAVAFVAGVRGGPEGAATHDTK